MSTETIKIRFLYFLFLKFGKGKCEHKTLRFWFLYVSLFQTHIAKKLRIFLCGREWTRLDLGMDFAGSGSGTRNRILDGVGFVRIRVHLVPPSEVVISFR